MDRDEPRSDDRRSAANRRRFLKGLGALGVVGLAGGVDTAYVETIEDVEVADNRLTIEAVSSQENPKFSGIEIQEA